MKLLDLRRKAKPKPHRPRILNGESFDPKHQICPKLLARKIAVLAQTLSEKKFYPYQTKLSYRVAYSVLVHDADVVTALFSRQSGKTETISSTVAAIGLVIPILAKKYPKSWHLNMTDTQGNYRGYRFGIKIGIYAPKQAQSEILFNRMKGVLNTDTAKQVMKELNITSDVNNGNTHKFSTGTRILCETASEQSKIEGETHHLLVAEEAQDIGDQKMKKSLHPMVAATLGTIVKIGTSTARKCDFYDAIKHNERMELSGYGRNHFYFPYQVCQMYNSLYAKFVEKEKMRIGENSDEFQMAFACKWVFERGMFITNKLLFHNDIACTESSPHNYFSILRPKGVSATYPHMNVIAGIDWGSSHDSTVITLVAVDWNNPIESGQGFDENGLYEYTFFKKHVIYWSEWVGDDYEYQYREILPFLRGIPNLNKVVLDSNTCGKPMFDRMKADFQGTGIEIDGFNFHSKLKSDGYKALYQELSGKRLTFPAAASVRNDVRYRKFTYQMLDLHKEYRNGLMVVKHPDEKHAHDDYPDSLMLANYGALTPAMGTGTTVSDHNFLLV